MFKDITSLSDLNEILSRKDAVLAYFSSNECNVCKVLKPKVLELLENSFPKVNQLYINLSEYPEIGSQHSIFTVSTILVYFQGKEFLRKSRNVGISELGNELKRPYEINPYAE